MKELPKKLEQHAMDGIPDMIVKTWNKVNQLIDYLESSHVEGRGEPEANVPTRSENVEGTQDWKEDFDEKFPQLYSYSEFGQADKCRLVKNFIESLLAEQKKELMEYAQKEVQKRMMKYDSKDGYSNLHDEIMEKVYDDVTDIFNNHD